MRTIIALLLLLATTGCAALDGRGRLAITPLLSGGRWTSGRVRTRREDFAVPAGGTTPGGPCREPRGLTSGEHPCPACNGSFHTYAVELTGSRTTWFLDGRPYFTLGRSLPRRFFLILNVAVGGGLPAAHGGGPTPATVPGRPMLVDYVSVATRQ
ncbi:hypothetical protein [Thermoactinospora rubra]|uniref:hypothetical protein n=1 Tax=Thermoactinospora rubra TaxID=1088767 RepID=UPI000A11B33F|nr:hypothetical protein [Thermoactinospora rubra]